MVNPLSTSQTRVEVDPNTQTQVHSVQGSTADTTTVFAPGKPVLEMQAQEGDLSLGDRMVNFPAFPTGQLGELEVKVVFVNPEGKKTKEAQVQTLNGIGSATLNETHKVRDFLAKTKRVGGTFLKYFLCNLVGGLIGLGILALIGVAWKAIIFSGIFSAVYVTFCSFQQTKYELEGRSLISLYPIR